MARLLGGSGFLCLILAFMVVEVSTQNTGGSDCHDSCALTFSKHTSQEGHLQESCSRGCRFYAMACRHSIHLPMQQCRQACNSSYEKTTEDNAGKQQINAPQLSALAVIELPAELTSCYQGCTIMKPLEDKRVQGLKGEMDVMSYYQAQNRFHQLVDSLMSRFMDEHPMLMGQGVPQNEMGDSDEHSGIALPDHSLNSHFTWYVVNVRPEYAQSRTMYQIPPWGPGSANDGLHPWVMIDRSGLEQRGAVEDERAEPKALEVEPEYRGCQWVVRRVGLPRVLLFVSLLLMSLAMFWVCCSTANARKRKDRQRRKNEAAKVQIKYHQDINYLEGSKCFVPQGLSIQAFPLPEKSAKL